MWTFVYGGALLVYRRPGQQPWARVALPDDALAHAVGPGYATCLCADGRIVRVHAEGGNQDLAMLELGVDIQRAAISANARMVVVSRPVVGSMTDTCTVLVWLEGAWLGHIDTPDFLVEVTDIRCAADGASFAYGFHTGQPWSDYGSYGDRAYGSVVLRADGSAERLDSDMRSHDEEPEIRIVWTPDFEHVLMSHHEPDRGSELDLFGPRGPTAKYLTPLGLFGIAREQSSDCVYLGYQPASILTSSPYGRYLVAVTDSYIHVVDTDTQRQAQLEAPAVAVDIRSNGDIGWLSGLDRDSEPTLSIASSSALAWQALSF